MMPALRFVWNATRGHRLRPWRSEYVKWRIETHSGMKADEMTTGEVLRYVWREKLVLLRFLRWTGEIESFRSRAAGGTR